MNYFKEDDFIIYKEDKQIKSLNLALKSNDRKEINIMDKLCVPLPLAIMTNTVLGSDDLDMKEKCDEISLISDELLDKLFNLANKGTMVKKKTRVNKKNRKNKNRKTRRKI